MTLSTELAGLMDALPGHRDDIGAYIEALTALNRTMHDNLPAIIAALKAAETPLGDYAGLVERLLSFDWPRGVNEEAADAITALTRQLAERDAENAAMRRIIYAYVDPCETRQDDEAFVLGIIRSQALGGDNAP